MHTNLPHNTKLWESFMEEEWWEGQGKKKKKTIYSAAYPWYAWSWQTWQEESVKWHWAASCSFYHVVVEEGQGCLQTNILPCQALTAESGRMSDDYSPAFSHLYPKSHLPPSKTLIILHFVVPVQCSVISGLLCTLPFLPLIIVVIAKVKEQLLYVLFFFFPTSFHSIWKLNKALAQFLLTWGNWQPASQTSAGKWNNTTSIMERQMG